MREGRIENPRPGFSFFAAATAARTVISSPWTSVDRPS